MKQMTKLIIAAFATTALLPSIAAAAGDAKNTDYVRGVNGNTVGSSEPGQCWHDGYWTPSSPVAPCGPAKEPVAAVTSAPAPVVAVAPTPIPPTEPAKTYSKKMSFSADALFAFNKSELKPEGKVMLDDLVSQLNNTTYETIVATGYTDRIGGVRYNQTLSLHRANAVKNYLVSRDIPSGRIDAEGRGKSQPVTAAGDCTGAKSAKVIACLQPDRRVDVEMKGVTTVTSSR
jgi:OOP family OmpA-OmpF porin